MIFVNLLMYCTYSLYMCKSNTNAHKNYTRVNSLFISHLLKTFFLQISLTFAKFNYTPKSSPWSLNPRCFGTAHFASVCLLQVARLCRNDRARCNVCCAHQHVFILHVYRIANIVPTTCLQTQQQNLYQEYLQVVQHMTKQSRILYTSLRFRKTHMEMRIIVCTLPIKIKIMCHRKHQHVNNPRKM